MRSCNKDKGGVCAEKGEDVSIVKRRKRKGVQVHRRTIEKGVYLTLKVTSNSTGVFCRKEGW